MADGIESKTSRPVAIDPTQAVKQQTTKNEYLRVLDSHRSSYLEAILTNKFQTF